MVHVCVEVGTHLRLPSLLNNSEAPHCFQIRKSMKPSTALSLGGGGEFSREARDWDAGVGRAQ